MARARYAEDLATAWYVRNGYQIVARNWRCPRGELDVVAWRAGVLVVCEVKARHDTTFGSPFEAITPRKLVRLRRATALLVAQLRQGAGSSRSGIENAFLAGSNFVKEVRFDAAAVVGGRLEMRCGVA
jgi:putative endonuclease